MNPQTASGTKKGSFLYPTYKYSGHEYEMREMPEDKRLKQLLYDQLQILEKLPGFKQSVAGAFSSLWNEVDHSDEYMSKILDGFLIPHYQTNYGDTQGRLRERLDQYAKFVRCLYVSRRNGKMFKLPYLPWVYQSESDVNRGYRVRALRHLEKTKSFIFNDPVESVETSRDLLERLLLCPIMDHARLQAMLNSVKGFVAIKKICENPLKWSLTYQTEFVGEQLKCLAATVGEWAEVQLSNRSRTKTRLHVIGAKGGNELVVGVGANMQRDVPYEFKVLNGTQKGFVVFQACDNTFKLPFTSTLEALTSLWDVFTQPTVQPLVGRSLIDFEQQTRLNDGEGFITNGLDAHQKRAAAKFLAHKRPFTIQSLISPPGTGKTHVVDEVILQVVKHHTEDYPNEASIHYGVPTNAGVRKTVQRLHEKGVDANKIVWLISETEVSREVDNMTINPTRISEYRLDCQHQVYIGTPQVLARLFMCVDHLFMLPPLLAILDEAASVSFGHAVGMFVMNGEPVQIILMGDTMQIEPRCLSEVNDSTFGRLTIFSVLEKLSPVYFKNERGQYLEPNDHAGENLHLNYRSHPRLTRIISELFYGGKMIPAPCMRMEMNHDLMKRINETTGLFDGKVDGPLIFVPYKGCVVRDPKTHSLYNTDECNVVAEFAERLARSVGVEHVCVLAPYREQVLKIKKQTASSCPRLLVNTVDEVQGQERRIVIVSLTRSNNGLFNIQSSRSLGFMSTPNRVNVLISRGKELVILFGDDEHYGNGGVEFWVKLLRMAEFAKLSQ